MIDALNGLAQIGLFILLMGLIYCIVQVVDVIREERERLMWYRHSRTPVEADPEMDRRDDPGL